MLDPTLHWVSGVSEGAGLGSGLADGPALAEPPPLTSVWCPTTAGLAGGANPPPAPWNHPTKELGRSLCGDRPFRSHCPFLPLPACSRWERRDSGDRREKALRERAPNLGHRSVLTLTLCLTDPGYPVQGGVQYRPILFLNV